MSQQPTDQLDDEFKPLMTSETSSQVKSTDKVPLLVASNGYGTEDPASNQPPLYYEETTPVMNVPPKKITFWTVFDFTKKWLALIVGCLIMLASGTQYVYSSIGPTIKK